MCIHILVFPMVKMEVLVPHKEKSYSAECSATYVANFKTNSHLMLFCFAVAPMDALFFFSMQNKSSTTEYVHHILGMITYLNKSTHTYINDMMQNLSMFQKSTIWQSLKSIAPQKLILGHVPNQAHQLHPAFLHGTYQLQSNCIIKT